MGHSTAGLGLAGGSGTVLSPLTLLASLTSFFHETMVVSPGRSSTVNIFRSPDFSNEEEALDVSPEPPLTVRVPTPAPPLKIPSSMEFQWPFDEFRVAQWEIKEPNSWKQKRRDITVCRWKPNRMREKLRGGREFRRWCSLTAHRTEACKCLAIYCFLVRSQRRCETIGGGREGDGRVLGWLGPHPSSKLRIRCLKIWNPLRTEHSDLYVYYIYELLYHWPSA